MNRISILLFFAFSFSSLSAQSTQPQEQKTPSFLMETNSFWVDSLMQAMTLDEKIGQLIMIAGYSNRNGAFEEEISDAIKKYRPGGIIFFQGNPCDQIRLTNKY